MPDYPDMEAELMINLTIIVQGYRHTSVVSSKKFCPVSARIESQERAGKGFARAFDLPRVSA